MNHNQQLDKLYEKNEELNALFHSYWNQYSDMGSWQFWVITLLLVLPLILLFFTVDRKRIFEVFFFGFVVHIAWSYTLIALNRAGYFMHNYYFIPYLPIAINVAGSLLPVGFLLVYQYTTKYKKSFYVYTLLLSVVFAYGFGSIEEYSGLTSYKKGMNQTYLFLIDIVIAFVAYWFTKLIKKISEK